MTELTHIMDGEYRGEPRGWQNLEIVIDWLNKKESGSINVSDLAFVGAAKDYISQRIKSGVNGGVGIFEGIPYQILVGEQTNPVFTFRGYLDMTDEELTVLGKEEIKVGLKKEQGEDWLADVADSFSFAYLYKIGIITQSDFVKVPYVINYVPDGLQLILISMSIYMMSKELIENIQAIAESIGDITDASTPVIGVSVGLGAGVVTAWDLGNYIMAALKVIARIAYAVAIIIAIKNLVEALFEQLMPKKRFHLGMRYKTMFEKACQYLDLTLSSSILDSIEDKVYIPPKDRQGGESGETGYPTNSSAIYIFGDLIRKMKEQYNADYRIQNGVFYFERRDSFRTPSIYQMPSFFTDQDRKLDANGYNTSELVANYNIYYEYDVQDQNTLDDQTGRVFQAITTPIVVGDQKLVNVKGLTQISIPYSQGKEKTKLTDVEKLLKTLGQVVDGLTGIFGGGTNFASKIEDRIGSLLLSSHFLTIGKEVVMSGAKLADNQRGLLDAKLLWDNYHYINSFAPYQGTHNQYARYKEAPVPMSLQDFALLLENNLAIDSEGNEYEIEKVIYNPYRRRAKLDYRIKELYTNNLKVEIV
jgi:hypothetical protein